MVVTWSVTLTPLHCLVTSRLVIRLVLLQCGGAGHVLALRPCSIRTPLSCFERERSNWIADPRDHARNSQSPLVPSRWPRI